MGGQKRIRSILKSNLIEFTHKSNQESASLLNDMQFSVLHKISCVYWHAAHYSYSMRIQSITSSPFSTQRFSNLFQNEK